MIKVTLEIDDDELTESLSLDNPKFTDIVKRVLQESDIIERCKEKVFEFLSQNLERITREVVENQTDLFDE